MTQKIKNIILKNFQSHEKTEMTLHDGVNCITGGSDTGKSSIIRSLYWLLWNKPSGLGVVSNWGKNKNGALSGEASVDVQFTDGTFLKKIRGRASNEYYLNDAKYSAVGRDVPVQIMEKVKIGEVNFQRQIDDPFLISASSGEVAQFFNRVINLEKIDELLKNAEAYRRANIAESKDVEWHLTEIAKTLRKYEWVDDAKDKLRILDAAKEKKESIAAQLLELEKSHEDHGRMYDKSFIFQEIIECIEPKYIAVAEVAEELERVGEVLEDMHQSYSSYMRRRGDLSQYRLYLSDEFIQKTAELEKLYEQGHEVKGELDTLEDDMIKFSRLAKVVEHHEDEIKNIRARLPKVCPMCGAAI